MTRKEFIEYYQRHCQIMSAMMKIAPKDKLDWKPNPNSWSLGQLLQHISWTPKSLVMTIHNTWPPQDVIQKSMANSINNPPMDGEQSVKEFEENMRQTIIELEKISDHDFLTKYGENPFGAKGSIGRLLQGAVDHQNNHKYQLFSYLKGIGLPVNTMTLYAGKTD